MPHRFGLFGPKQDRSASLPSEPCVKEFKECVDEVRNEYPHLAAGAIDQLAMQRFTERTSHTQQSNVAVKRTSAPQLINKCFTKFLPRKPSRDVAMSTETNKWGHLEVESQLEQQRSIPLRKNISVGDDLEHIESIHGSILSNWHDTCESLANSLSNIELDVSERITRQSSILSECAKDELDDLLSINSAEQLDEEDEIQIKLNDLQSLSTHLEDVKVTLANSDHPIDNGTKPIVTPVQCGKRNSMQRGRHGSIISRLSLTDSLTSFDEMNFRGDFSAWCRRRSSRASFISSMKSLRRDSCLSVTSSESFNAGKGDFTAWDRRRESLVEN